MMMRNGAQILYPAAVRSPSTVIERVRKRRTAARYYYDDAIGHRTAAHSRVGESSRVPVNHDPVSLAPKEEAQKTRAHTHSLIRVVEIDNGISPLFGRVVSYRVNSFSKRFIWCELFRLGNRVLLGARENSWLVLKRMKRAGALVYYALENKSSLTFHRGDVVGYRNARDDDEF